MVDGTGVILQDGKGRTTKSTEMRWALASAGEREPFKPVGLWVDKDWREIKKDLKERLNYSLIEVLFSDGELAMELLLEEGMRHQRCLVHGKRDKGLINWLMVTINKIFYPHMWEELWNQYLELNPGFELLFIRSSYRWS